MNEFNNYIRNKRIALGLTLKAFCEKKGYADVAYISRLENGLLSPPKSQEKLRALASALELKPETEEWVEFFDLAATARGELPSDIKENFSVTTQFLPAFYRSVRSQEVNENDLKKLLKLLNGKGEPDNNA